MSDKCEVRPIYANALCEILEEKADMVLVPEYKHAFLNVLAMVNAIPTIDAVPMDEHKKRMEAETKKRVLAEETNRRILENYVPLVHGKWIQSKTIPDYFHCSCCKVSNKMKKSCNTYVLPKYCHCCGAKMDGGKDDENA
ncbi:MAG: hypothetical protein SPG80_13440 [Candidatus Ventricola sp.]|nr:hypothetical protein [Candidatus Ventricola sp.]